MYNDNIMSCNSRFCRGLVTFPLNLSECISPDLRELPSLSSKQLPMVQKIIKEQASPSPAARAIELRREKANKRKAEANEGVGEQKKQKQDKEVVATARLVFNFSQERRYR